MPVKSNSETLVITLLASLPIIVIIAVMGGSALVRRALRPVEAMRATAEQISFSKLSLRLPETETGDAIENLSKTINQRFYRADKVRSNASQDADLGLSIVRSMCQAHGGTLEATSVESVGTTLTVKLPFAARPNF